MTMEQAQLIVEELVRRYFVKNRSLKRNSTGSSPVSLFKLPSN